MQQIVNFSPGPAMLPRPVLERARADLLDYRNTGMSVMEISHRGAMFDEMANHTETTLRGLLTLPEDYAVLFLAGGATQQMSLLPMNLAQPGTPGAYVINGLWGLKALHAATTLGLGVEAASDEQNGFSRIPDPHEWRMPGTAAYVHITSNETIGGVQFQDWPDTAAPLVADMSSDLLSRPLDTSRFGVIYASAQKNIGQAGITLVLVRRDLLNRSPDQIPRLFSWAQQDAQESRLNTPPTYAWYVAGLVFDWIVSEGGLDEMRRRSEIRAAMVYGVIGESGFYLNDVSEHFRSKMNVPFRLAEPRLEPVFLQEAESAGLFGLKGHKLLGGMRASIYNAMPLEGVETLVQFMREFERRWG